MRDRDRQTDTWKRDTEKRESETKRDTGREGECERDRDREIERHKDRHIGNEWRESVPGPSIT